MFIRIYLFFDFKTIIIRFQTDIIGLPLLYFLIHSFRLLSIFNVVLLFYSWTFELISLQLRVYHLILTTIYCIILCYYYRYSVCYNLNTYPVQLNNDILCLFKSRLPYSFLNARISQNCINTFHRLNIHSKGLIFKASLPVVIEAP